MIIQPPQANIPIVDENGSMQRAFGLFTNAVSRLPIIVGTGSPEGVIPAGISRQYMDDAGSTGSILYIKKLTDIGGDEKQGWILV